MGFELPPRTKIGHLDPEIASEGQKVILSDGEQVNWSPPPTKPCIPDWSEIKSIRRYFNRTGYQVYPAWLYHENGEERLVKNADEAAQLGVCFRKASDEERNRYGVQSLWDWQDDSKWRPQPWILRKFDPHKAEQGKNYVPATPDPMAAQLHLLAGLTDAIKNNQVQKPAEISDKDWQDFQQFLAFKKAQTAAVPEIKTGKAELDSKVDLDLANSALQSFAAQAERKNEPQRGNQTNKR